MSIKNNLNRLMTCFMSWERGNSLRKNMDRKSEIKKLRKKLGKILETNEYFPIEHNRRGVGGNEYYKAITLRYISKNLLLNKYSADMIMGALIEMVMDGSVHVQCCNHANKGDIVFVPKGNYMKNNITLVMPIVYNKKKYLTFSPFNIYNKKRYRKALYNLNIILQEHYAGRKFEPKELQEEAVPES